MTGEHRDPYVDPVTGVMRNKLGIADAALLDEVERRVTTQRLREGFPA